MPDLPHQKNANAELRQKQPILPSVIDPMVKSRKFAASPSGSLELGSNPPHQTHGHSGAEPPAITRSERTSSQKRQLYAMPKI